MLPARLLGASRLEAAAGGEGHSDGGAGERGNLGLVLHPSEVGVAEDVVGHAHTVRPSDTDGQGRSPAEAPGGGDLRCQAAPRSPQPARGPFGPHTLTSRGGFEC